MQTKRFLQLGLVVLGMGLLGACSNSDLDDLEKRVDVIESKSIATINDQIKGINASIADLGTIREDILDLQVAVGAKGGDISDLQAADVALGKRIDELKEYVGDLSKYADKDWVNATFATLEQHRKTVGDLKAIDEKVGNLDERLTKAIKDVSDNLNATIKDLSDRVSALEAMIQSVSIVPAYSDGSVEANGDILTINFVVSPASAAASLTKDSINVLVDETKTRGASYTTLAAESAEVDPVTGDVTITADISGCTPAEGKSLTAAVKVKNGISNYTTEFVPVTVMNLPPVVTDEFSVSNTKKVKFAPGNLQAKWNGSKYEWAFAAHQWDYIGNKAGNTKIKDDGTNEVGAVVDLFCWTKAGLHSDGIKQYGINKTTDSSDYGDATDDTCCDWGKTIDNKGTWRTLTIGEWIYLTNSRGDKSWAKATINSDAAGVAGLLLFPDSFSWQSSMGTAPSYNNATVAFTANTYTSTQFAAMEAANVVFLPCAGYRSGTSVIDVGSNGSYWSCSADFSITTGAYFLSFKSPQKIYHSYRSLGQSVRLVTDVPADPAPYSFTGGFASEGYDGK